MLTHSFHTQIPRLCRGLWRIPLWQRSSSALIFFLYVWELLSGTFILFKERKVKPVNANPVTIWRDYNFSRNAALPAGMSDIVLVPHRHCFSTYYIKTPGAPEPCNTQEAELNRKLPMKHQQTPASTKQTCRSVHWQGAVAWDKIPCATVMKKACCISVLLFLSHTLNTITSHARFPSLPSFPFPLAPFHPLELSFSPSSL